MSVTLRAALREAVAALKAADVPEAAGDARRLVEWAAGLGPGGLTLRADDPLAPDAAARLAAALAARAARQPVAQILGARLFWGRSFRVTRDTLDPRPETETLVAAALAEPFARVLDLGTGTGAILVSLLADRPEATGLGVDLSPAALSVAEGNARALGVADRAAFALSDWWAGVRGRFDLIVSNPPYIPAADLAQLAPEVRDWEPHLALSPGVDGLAAYRAIAAGAPAHLAPGGRLLAEVGAGQAEAVAALWQAAGLAEVRTLPDLDGRARVVAGRHAQP